jgi:hypothetical protein
MYNVKIHTDDPQQFHLHMQLVLREEDWKERVIDIPQQLLQSVYLNLKIGTVIDPFHCYDNSFLFQTELISLWLVSRVHFTTCLDQLY